MLVCVVAEEGTTQTRFEIPDTTPNYSAYGNTDECLAAVLRLKYQAAIKDSVWNDTLFAGLRFKQKPISAEAIALGRKCLMKLDIDTVHATGRELEVFAKVLLMTGRDADLMKLVMRLLDSAKSSSEWGQIYWLVVEEYKMARPVRINALQQLLPLTYRNDTSTDLSSQRMSVKIDIAFAALALGDTTTPRQIVEDILGGEFQKLTPTRRNELHESLFGLVSEVFLEQGLDSLRVATDSYRKYLEHLWRKFTDEPFTQSGEAVGDTAPMVKGTYWFKNHQSTDSSDDIRMRHQVSQIDSQTIPVRGKVNAILYLHGNCHTFALYLSNFARNDGGGSSCWKSATLVKRLKYEFPNLEVTVVTQTFGTFGGSGPMSPNEEAQVLSKYFLGFFQIQAIQATIETDFVRMPGLDQRRLDVPVAFRENYENLLARSSIVLIDDQGQIFHNTVNWRATDRNELIMRRKLRVVFSRIDGH